MVSKPRTVTRAGINRKDCFAIMSLSLLSLGTTEKRSSGPAADLGSSSVRLRCPVWMFRDCLARWGIVTPWGVFHNSAMRLTHDPRAGRDRASHNFSGESVRDELECSGSTPSRCSPQLVSLCMIPCRRGLGRPSGPADSWSPVRGHLRLRSGRGDCWLTGRS